jgi:uncharacterized protein
MLEYLRPNLTFETIYDVNLDLLGNRGIKGILINIDNTLAPWRAEVLENKAKEWLIRTKSRGFKVGFVSNGHKVRIGNLVKDLDIPYVYQARKPAKSGFLRGLKLLKTTPRETALIGDQIFTDILGGNRLGLTTILVEPIDKNYEFITTKILRVIENILRVR